MVLLLMLEAKLRSDVSSKGPIQLTIETGYWVTLVAYVAGAGLGIREITAGRGGGGRATDDRAPDV